MTRLKVVARNSLMTRACDDARNKEYPPYFRFITFCLICSHFQICRNLATVTSLLLVITNPGPVRQEGALDPLYAGVERLLGVDVVRMLMVRKPKRMLREVTLSGYLLLVDTKIQMLINHFRLSVVWIR